MTIQEDIIDKAAKELVEQEFRNAQPPPLYGVNDENIPVDTKPPGHIRSPLKDIIEPLNEALK